ncbi:tetraether lipid synthase Tes [Methanobacterium paludis]|uniref:Radical SAM domain protein n=1 Tax=Methanobacterium paludis (strain DSM 25820 / JCM 18151 / SWAN1) TaxID=868131 RepID=F6D6J6_METPW|nr:radical SAM protein [Methanobacterium paludis]AEG17709.1 Radical SAM domain protein [Methanobacterium paludis]
MFIKQTKSLCPECLKVLDAEVYEDKDKIMIKKECKEHGKFENTYWSSDELYEMVKEYGKVGVGIENPQTTVEGECPQNCGLCSEHESHTVLGLIDVTNRCNMKCPVCFANAAVSKMLYEPSYEEIRQMLKNLRNNQPVPTPAIQYAGGEPTMRKDLVELVKLAKEEGFSHTQIATNGIKLAKNPQLSKDLKEAGLNTVYLQFDGITEEPYLKIRNRNLLSIKLEAIENCRAAGLGIVLVPTLLKGINHDQVGDIIKFAVDNIDIIRGVNFQPVSFAGRTPAEEVEEQRVTIPDFEKFVEEQTDSQIKVEDFYPASCVTPVSEFVEAMEGGKPQVTFTCNPHCGTATYVFVDNDEMVPITQFIDVDRFFDLLNRSTNDIKKGGIVSKAKVLARASVELPRTVDMSKSPESVDIKSIMAQIFRERSYAALGEFHHNSLLVSCMHFMDPWNFDQDRVRQCVIHYAVPDGRIIPFCSMNTIYRNEIEKKFSKPLNKD